jgi:adenylate cyclase, class 2
MGVEIEAKMSVADHETVRAALAAAGARRISDCLEINRILDNKDHTLESSGKGLRVRVTRNLADRSETTTLTIKGPLIPGPLKSRDEFEMIVDNAAEALGFFKTLGYEPVVSFQKRRETWELRGSKIELDEVPYLGKFVEIEGPNETEVFALRESLGLSGQPIIKTSYVALLIEYLKRRSLPMVDVAFG